MPSEWTDGLCYVVSECLTLLPAHGGGHEPGEAEEGVDEGKGGDHQHVLS